MGWLHTQAEVAYAKLEAENGAVQLIGYQGSLAPSEDTVGVFAPESRVVGIKMLKKDADILRTEVTNNYGLPTQNEPVYVVIDVLWVPSPPMHPHHLTFLVI